MKLADVEKRKKQTPLPFNIAVVKRKPHVREF
jgi:hypothetical protein